MKEDFENDSAGTRGWYGNTVFTTTSAEHMPGSKRSLAWGRHVGQTLPTFGAASRHLFTPTTQLYVNYWVKYSDNWIGSGKPCHPHEIQFLTTEAGAYAGSAVSTLTTYIEHNYQNGGIPVLWMSDDTNVDATGKP